MALWGSSVRSRSAPPVVYSLALRSPFTFVPRCVLLKKETLLVFCFIEFFFVQPVSSL